MSVEENKAIVIRLLEEVVIGGNFELLDQLLAPDFVNHGQFGFSGGSGFETFRKEIQMLHTAFPDMAVRILHLVGERDTVVAHLQCEGTHRGSFQAIAATGRKVAYPSIMILRIEGGKVAERWDVFDRYGYLQQLGVIPGG